MYIFKATINFDILNNYGKSIGGNTISVKGIAPQSIEHAKAKAAKNISKKIKKDGISKVLNINL